MESTSVDLWDRTNEKAVLNVVSPEVQNCFIDATQKEPELFGRDERDLFRILRTSNRTPTPTDNRLRLAFWLEYERAVSLGKPMQMAMVFTGVTSKQMFYTTYISSPSRLAWMLTPPVAYLTKIAEALDFGLDRMREILEREPIDAKGKFDVRLAELQAKITWNLELRVKGAVVTKIEQKTMGLNIHTTDKQVAQAALEGSMEDLQKRMKELDKKERALMSLPNDVPRESTVVEAEVEGSDGTE